jgi:hypothetical protein
VQRAFLCGCDPATGCDFNYRRGWIEDLLAYQAGVFAVDVGNYNLLSNHAHAILRTRPDIAALWSPEQLALRWKMAWPEFRDGTWVREPTDQELEQLLLNPVKIEQIRRNLSSLSWFMARWKEPIAKLCNAESGNSGHFWASRFRCRELLDEAAVLTCSIYVDLNQLQAGMVGRLEDSQHSAIRNRIAAAKRREVQAACEAFAERETSGRYQLSETDAEELFEDCWLVPICAQGPLLTADSLPQAPLEVHVLAEAVPPATDSEQTATGVEQSEPGSEQPDGSTTKTADTGSASGNSPVKPTVPHAARRLRASDAAILDIPWSESERILREVIRLKGLEVVASDGEAGHAPSADHRASESLDATLAQWGIHTAAWLTSLDQLDHSCTRLLGAAHRVLERAHRVALQWVHGIGLCRAWFVGTESDEFT